MGKGKNKTVQTFLDEPQVDESQSDELFDSEAGTGDKEEPSDEGSGTGEDSEDQYIVNPDRPRFSICGTRKGIRVQGDVVTPSMFRGGQSVFDSLVKSGALVKKKD